MVIAVVAMNVMQVAIHQIVDVITVWDCFMATTGPMDMILIMSAAIMCWSTFVWVRFGELKRNGNSRIWIQNDFYEKARFLYQRHYS